MLISCAFARPALAFDSVVRGATADVGVATTPVGDTGMGELGGESEGLRSSADRRWVFAWDVLAALRAGWVVAQRPPLSFVGAHTLAWTELGVRALPSSDASPYVGARISGDAAVMPSPGLSLSALDTVSRVDGVGGIVARGLVRVDAGLSFLDRARSLIVVAFAEESFDAPGVYTPGLALTAGGLAVRFDVARSFLAEVEGAYGLSATRTDALRGLTDQTTRAAVSGDVRKIFENGMWLGLQATYARDTDHVAYAHGLAYDTGSAPTIGLSISYGLSLGKAKP